MTDTNLNKIPKQSGLIISLPKENDFIHGGESSLNLGAVNLQSGNWKDYLPQGERQYCPFFDTMSCTTFSFCDAVETYMNFLIANNRISANNLSWLKDKKYIGLDGKVNFSDRFLAILSGTTKQGNRFDTVAETARTRGLIPESLFTFDPAITTWEEYMDASKITTEMISLASEFLSRFKLSYEWIFVNKDSLLDGAERSALLESLKTLPLQIAIPYPATHAIELFGIITSPEELEQTLDHYEPFLIDRKGTPIHYAMRHLIEEIATVINNPVVVPADWSYNFTKTARKGDTGDHILAIQKALWILGFFKSPADFAPVFGNRTFTALVAYQKSVNLPATGYFGAMTMAKFNERFNKNYTKPVIASDLAKWNLKPKVSRLAADFLNKAKEKGFSIAITEGFRSFERQTQLYNQVPKITNAKAGMSFHNYGLAFDICFIKDGKATYVGDWEGIGKVGEECGLEWGGSWGNIGTSNESEVYNDNWVVGFIDKPHFQFTAGHTIEEFFNNKVDFSIFN